MTSSRRRLILASRSERRQQLLRDAGIDFDLASPTIDDTELACPDGVDPGNWVAGLAHLKACSIPHAASDSNHLILGADTVIVADGLVIGQPRSIDDARAILERLISSSHEVVTGVALLGDQRRLALVDRASVTFGEVLPDGLDSYLTSGDWRGKAGGYNLFERIDDGWPITFEGDPATIMGLPIGRILPLLERMGVEADSHQASAPGEPGRA